MNEPLPPGPHLQSVPKAQQVPRLCTATQQLCNLALAAINDDDQEEDSNSNDNGKEDFVFS